jgi:hypothetical protein
MARTTTERLATLEQKVSDMSKTLNENTRDTKAIRATLDNLSGGKQALMWFTGLLMSVLVVLATWLGFHK